MSCRALFKEYGEHMDQMQEIIKSFGEAPPHMLVVDDESDIRELVCGQLEDWGIKTTQAENAEEAIRQLRESEFAAVLSDITMTPGFSGLDLLKRAQASGIAPPFVFLAASGSFENILRAVRLGAFDFIVKPYKAGELQLVIARILGIAYRQREINHVLDDLGEKIAPQLRDHIEDLRRQISMLRIFLDEKR